MFEEHVARLILRILEDVGDRVDGTAYDTRVVEHPVDLGCVTLSRPLCDDPLDLLLVPTARKVRLKAFV
jgi:hypothetical protein